MPTARHFSRIPCMTLAVTYPDAAVAVGAWPDGGPRPVITGPRAATELVESVEADVVLNGITGSIGLEPTLAALRAGRILALANKESLVAGGSLVTAAAAPGQIVPVDSRTQRAGPVPAGRRRAGGRKLVVTASGRSVPWSDSGADAARSPPRRPWLTRPGRWARSSPSTRPPWSTKDSRSSRRTCCSAIPYDRIDVVVHPQSVIHSMVTFVDGSTIAQASPPDMRLPIALALGLAAPAGPGGCGVRLQSGGRVDVRAGGPTTRSRPLIWPSPPVGRAGRCRRRSTPPTRKRSTPSARPPAFHRHLRRAGGASLTRPTTSGATRGTCTTSGPRKTGPARGPGDHRGESTARIAVGRNE